MTRFIQIRLALAVIGIVVWGFGAQQDEPRVRLVGLLVLALSLALRFVPKRFQRGADPPV